MTNSLRITCSVSLTIVGSCIILYGETMLNEKFSSEIISFLGFALFLLWFDLVHHLLYPGTSGFFSRPKTDNQQRGILAILKDQFSYKTPRKVSHLIIF